MEISGTNSGPELLVELDRTRAEPLHRQLTDGLRDAIRTGRLEPHSRMPPSRVLAADLGVSRRLVVDAYGHLVAEGFLLSRQGSGTLVAAIDTASPPAPHRHLPEPRYDIDFGSGYPDLSGFPRAAWLRALRAALASAPSNSFGYVPPRGLDETREALASYLRRTRGVIADPAQIVICSGASQGVGLIARTLHEVGALPFAVEDPGFWLHRLVLQHNHIETIPIPVDGAGLDVATLAASRARAVLTTAAHQSPTGVVLAADRRIALVDWAHDGKLIVEDDYDSEFRFDRAPVSALHALAPDRVIYLGSASKTLAPGLRIGWMVLPAELVGMATAFKGLADSGNSVTDQLAFAQLLNSGEYDRHLRQMRKRYRLRRNAMLEALGRHLPEAQIRGAAAGIQLCVHFPLDYNVEEIVRRAAALRVKVETLDHWYVHGDAAHAGLIMGYANLSESRIAHGVKLLAQAVHGRQGDSR